jgi:hypothetical protein
MPHVFQLFAPVNSMARMALKRLGTFIFEQTGKSRWKPFFQKETVRILNQSGFPVELVPDAFGIIQDGVHTLVEYKIWKLDMVDGVFHVSRT